MLISTLLPCTCRRATVDTLQPWSTRVMQRSTPGTQGFEPCVEYAGPGRVRVNSVSNPGNSVAKKPKLFGQKHAKGTRLPLNERCCETCRAPGQGCRQGTAPLGQLGGMVRSRRPLMLCNDSGCLPCSYSHCCCCCCCS